MEEIIQNENPFGLIQADGVVGAVIELDCARRDSWFAIY
jgi:hypothetical protein